MKQLYVECSGHGPDLVLLHGWGMHSGVWSKFSECLRENFKVTLIDLPGCGRSASFNGDYDLAELTNIILQHTPDRAAYLGWSFGGLLGMSIALDHPSRIDRLITICSSPCLIAAEGWPGIKLESIHDFEKQLLAESDETSSAFLHTITIGSSAQRNELRFLLSEVRRFGSPSRSDLLRVLALLKTTDLRSHFSQLECPVFGLFGENDAVVPLASEAKQRELFSDISTEVISGEGHAPFLTQPQMICKLITDFITYD